MTTDAQTIGVYDTQAADYAKLVGGAGDATLIRFLARLPTGADVLDLGCGPGHSAAFMRDQGYNVTATDASAEMAALGLRVHGLDVRVASFDDLADVAVYDGVWASFSLLHAPKAAMPGYLAAVHRALRKGGYLTIGLKIGDGEDRDSLGRFYAYYQLPEITELLQTAGFTVIGKTRGTDKGLDGQMWPWVVLDAHA